MESEGQREIFTVLLMGVARKAMESVHKGMFSSSASSSPEETMRCARRKSKLDSCSFVINFLFKIISLHCVSIISE
jgi:hypothetical protein